MESLRGLLVAEIPIGKASEVSEAKRSNTRLVWPNTCNCSECVILHDLTIRLKLRIGARDEDHLWGADSKRFGSKAKLYQCLSERFRESFNPCKEDIEGTKVLDDDVLNEWQMRGSGKRWVFLHVPQNAMPCRECLEVLGRETSRKRRASRPSIHRAMRSHDVQVTNVCVARCMTSGKLIIDPCWLGMLRMLHCLHCCTITSVQSVSQAVSCLDFSFHCLAQAILLVRAPKRI